MRKLLSNLSVLALVALCLGGVSLTQDAMNQLKREKRLTDTDPVDNAPPIVAFTTVALGCFRGLAADMLWLRSINLQEQGKYFEMVQLASWICKLQPRFAGASVYLAWNMAYNISMTFGDPADRWRWVGNGLRVLREVVVYNPADPVVYKDMAWIYMHKIGDVLDIAHKYYKTELASEMTKAYGGVADPDWKALASAPRSSAKLSEFLPTSSTIWADVEKAGFASLSDLERKFRADGHLPAKLSEECQSKAELRLLEFYLRATWLRSDFGIDPDEVVRINGKYGKLDWRLPNTFALYWASLGVKHSRESRSIDLERIVNNALKGAFHGWPPYNPPRR